MLKELCTKTALLQITNKSYDNRDNEQINAYILWSILSIKKPLKTI